MKRHATAEEKRQWADLGHIAFLDALMYVAPFEIKDIAFQGGTSLHLGWGSPRFSEDLDFLVGRADAHEIMRKGASAVVRRMTRLLMGHDQRLQVEMRDKTKNGDRMLVFDLVISHADCLGVTKVKTEFWCVPSEYLAQYPSVLRTPILRSGDLMGRIESELPMPTARLDAILADKIVALAYRGRVKWRDIFDVWWLAEQMERYAPAFTIRDLAAAAERHATAYEGPGLRAGLSSFLQQRERLLSGEGCDLDRWLPQPLSRLLVPDRVPDMVIVTLSIVDLAVLVLDHPESREASRGISRSGL